MLSAEGNDLERIARLAKLERAEAIVRYVAAAMDNASLILETLDQRLNHEVGWCYTAALHFSSGSAIHLLAAVVSAGNARLDSYKNDAGR